MSRFKKRKKTDFQANLEIDPFYHLNLASKNINSDRLQQRFRPNFENVCNSSLNKNSSP